MQDSTGGFEDVGSDSAVQVDPSAHLEIHGLQACHTGLGWPRKANIMCPLLEHTATQDSSATGRGLEVLKLSSTAPGRGMVCVKS